MLNNLTQRVLNPPLKGAQACTFWSLGTVCETNHMLYTEKFCLNNLAQRVVNPLLKGAQTDTLWSLGALCEKNRPFYIWIFVLNVQQFDSKGAQPPAERSSSLHFLKLGNCMWDESYVVHGEILSQQSGSKGSQPPAERSSNRHFVKFGSSMWEKSSVLHLNFCVKCSTIWLKGCSTLRWKELKQVLFETWELFVRRFTCCTRRKKLWESAERNSKK